MSIFEYDEERELKLLREAEYQAGVEDGIEVGRNEGIAVGRSEGFKIGRKEGFTEAISLSRVTFLKIIKKTSNDFESIYQVIKDEELFSDLSKKEICVLFDQI